MKKNNSWDKVKKKLRSGAKEFVKDNVDTIFDLLEEHCEEKKLKKQYINNICDEYFQLVGNDPDDQLTDYITNSVNGYFSFYNDRGEKRANLYAISRLDKAKTDFNLEAKVVDAVDAKIEYFGNKL